MYRTPIISIALCLLVACDDAELTTAELQSLARLAFVPPPPDPTNAVADDPRAAALGLKLFFDARLSGPLVVGDDGQNGGLGPAGATGKVACASCHNPEQAGIDTRSRPRNTSLGARWGSRNAKSLYNLAFVTWNHWTGTGDTVWSAGPVALEAGSWMNGSRLEVVRVVGALYRADYEAIFGALPDMSDAKRFPAKGKPGLAAYDAMDAADKQIVTAAMANLGKALHAYLRRLIDRDSAFDRYLAGEREALSAAALRGARLFVGRAACDECHSGPILSDGRFHNIGVPQVGAMVALTDRGRADGIKRFLASEFTAAGPYSDAKLGDHVGLLETPADVGAFLTPTLRSVSRSGPYMHTGALATLRDVLVFYRDGAGSGFSGTVDPARRALRLADRDLDDLIEFLKSLDGAPLAPDLTMKPVPP